MTQRDTKKMAGGPDPEILGLPLAASTSIDCGELVCDNGSGYAVVGSVATTLIAVGRAEESVDNSAGAAGDKTITVRRGTFLYNNHADAVVLSDRFSLCYIVDGKTVAKTSGSDTRSIAGVVIDVTAEGVWVAVGMVHALSYASVASSVTALETDALTAQGFIPVPLTALREATAFDVGAITANGGVLASDTTPILSAINDATDGCQRVTWAASNNDQVIFQFPLPPDYDDTADIKLYTRIASGGTTNAVGFSVASYFDEADTAVADTSATNQTTTYANALTTIAAADVPAGASTLTVGLTPVAHTTDTLNLTAVWILYKRKLLTS